jgi:hypothetical protein
MTRDHGGVGNFRCDRTRVDGGAKTVVAGRQLTDLTDLTG